MIHARNHVIVIVVVAALAGVAVYGSHLRTLGRYEDAHRAWQQEREREMREIDTSWLALAGLFWLPERGAATMGTDPSNDFVLEDGAGAPRIGRFVREGDSVRFTAEEGVRVRHDGNAVSHIAMAHDRGSDENPATTLEYGSLRWWIIQRDGMLGVRVKDFDSPSWMAFTGIPSFPFDAGWRLDARFIPFDAPREMEYPTILGTTRIEAVPGVLQFVVGEQSYELLPFVRREGTQLWIVFGDETNGDQTYGGGRFLYVDVPESEGGMTVIDFNRAYNPPCAFTPYSTCPQPLLQNRLPISVYAGEQTYRTPPALADAGR